MTSRSAIGLTVLALGLAACAGVGQYRDTPAVEGLTAGAVARVPHPTFTGSTEGYIYALLPIGIIEAIGLGSQHPVRTRGERNGTGITTGRDGELAETYGFAPTSAVVIYGRHGMNRTIQLAANLSGYSLTLDAQSSAYVAAETTDNPPHFAIEVFAPNPGPSDPPVRTLEGPNTELALPRALAIDAAGYLYVANARLFEQKADQVLIFAPGASGNQRPKRVISGDQTGLTALLDLTLGADGNIYVANQTETGYTIVVFPTTAGGNVAPIRTLQSAVFGTSVALGDQGEMFLGPSLGNKSIAIFAPGASGDDAPIGYFGKFVPGDEPTHLSLQHPWYEP